MLLYVTLITIMGHGFSHASFSASTFVPCFRILPWVEQRQARVLNGNCRTWSTPEDDGISNRGWKHLLHPLLRKNWDAFSDFQWFQLVPIWILHTAASQSTRSH